MDLKSVGERVDFSKRHLGGGHVEIACRLKGSSDIVAVITHPPGGKWIVHPTGPSVRQKHRTQWLARAAVEGIAEKIQGEK